jgi:hypothetical protein
MTNLQTKTACANNTILEQVLQGYKSDTGFISARHLKQFQQYADGSWRKDDKVVVPNIAQLKLRIMKKCHDIPVSKHVGQSRTQHLVERNFWWPGLYSDVLSYVRGCDACQQNKSSNMKPAGLLQPLPIPTRKWQSISMDLITALPKTRSGKDAIVVFVVS